MSETPEQVRERVRDALRRIPWYPAPNSVMDDPEAQAGARQVIQDHLDGLTR